MWVEKNPWTTLVSLCLSIGQYRFFSSASVPVSSNERHLLLKLLFDTLLVLASSFLANERYLVFER